MVSHFLFFIYLFIFFFFQNCTCSIAILIFTNICSTQTRSQIPISLTIPPECPMSHQDQISSHIPSLTSVFISVLQEPSLFAVAKLLETGLVNLPRVNVLWKPVTAHLLEVRLLYCWHGISRSASVFRLENWIPHQGGTCQIQSVYSVSWCCWWCDDKCLLVSGFSPVWIVNAKAIIADIGMRITQTRYKALSLFATRFTACARGIRVSFMQPHLF